MTDRPGTIDHVEQLTYLLFLTMAHKRATRPLKPERIVPDDLSSQRLLDADGASRGRAGYGSADEPALHARDEPAHPPTNPSRT